MGGKQNWRRLVSGLVIFSSVMVAPAVAEPGAKPSWREQADAQFHHQQQQQKARDNELMPAAPDIRLSVDPDSASQLDFPPESPCFEIKQVVLTNQSALPGWVPLQALADQAIGHCLGIKGINRVMSTLQNRLISHGWVTTRILAPEQDLRRGVLTLLIIPGTVHQIELTPDSSRYITLTTALPVSAGRRLDLRDIEQGMENLQRLPTAESRISLRPGDKPGESNVVIERSQRRFWRVGAWLDDSGTESTGRYQGGVMLALDNPTSLSDLLYVTASHDLGFAGRKNSKNISGHYSVPLGYWQLGVTATDANYHQTAAGRNADILYGGKSQSLTTQVSRVLHRNAASKTVATYDVLMKESRNFIGDVEIEDQKRRTSAWRLGLSHRRYWGEATVDAGVSYQRGTRWFGARPAPEEYWNDEGGVTALSKILIWDASASFPFSLSQQKLSYSLHYRRQTSITPLTPQDEFVIGNRWTVRGFDGERTLSASQGWTVQNTLAWRTPLPAQELYLGADYGAVDGNSTTRSDLSHSHLAGGVAGLRGNLMLTGMSYDVFIGRPFSRPAGFKTDHVTSGFSLNWNY